MEVQGTPDGCVPRNWMWYLCVLLHRPCLSFTHRLVRRLKLQGSILEHMSRVDFLQLVPYWHWSKSNATMWCFRSIFLKNGKYHALLVIGCSRIHGMWFVSSQPMIRMADFMHLLPRFTEALDLSLSWSKRPHGSISDLRTLRLMRLKEPHGGARNAERI